MRYLLEFTLLIAILSGIGIALRGVYFWVKERIEFKAMLRNKIEEALNQNSRRGLENILMIYEDHLNRSLKENIKCRIAELSNEESKVAELDGYVQRLSQKSQMEAVAKTPMIS